MDLPESHSHPHHTGHRWVDYVIAGTALLVSLISLFIAIELGHTMEKLVAANSWPNIEVAIEIGKTAQGVGFGVNLKNSGVGPGFIESIEMWQDGKPLPSLRVLAKSVLAAAGQTGKPVNLASQTVIGTVVASRDSVPLLRMLMPGLDVATAGTLVPISRTLRIRTCFCSVFDECYIADSDTPRERPKPVEACPVPKQAFDDDVATALG